MGIADVKRAFDAGLGGKATCKNATLTYERASPESQKHQVLHFEVMAPDGSVDQIHAGVPPNVDINAHANALAKIYAANLEGGGE